nr:MAG TPA: hypothetical protein [Caudoviricetes sp.]
MTRKSKRLSDYDLHDFATIRFATFGGVCDYENDPRLCDYDRAAVLP